MDIIQKNKPGSELVTTTNSMPPIVAGHDTPEMHEQVEAFYRNVAGMFEAWITRRKSVHTQRTYRRSVMNFIEFMEIPWPKPEYEKTDKGQKLTGLYGPDESFQFLQCTVKDLLSWRSYMDDELDQAPATLNHRITSVSSFYKYLRESAAVFDVGHRT